MKKLVVLIICMALTGVVYAQVDPLTDQELQDARKLLAYKAELENLAKTQSNATLPIELTILKQERLNIISQMETDLRAEDIKANNAKQVIRDNYAITISQKEGEISSKQSSIDNLVTP